VGTGRLGNQLFQLNGIEYFTRHIKKRNFILFNMPEIIQALNLHPCYKVINNKHFVKFYDKILKYILYFFYKLRIIGSLNCKYSYIYNIKYEYTYSLQLGILPIIWIPTLYFQKANLAHTFPFSIQHQHIQNALTFIDNLPPFRNYIYIHIRKTDYKTYTVLGKTGADLPLSYFRRAIQCFIQNIENPYFIFLTDDREFVEDNFSDISEKSVSNLDQYGDLALMSLCEYGIISNSSFSWWGSYFMKNRKKVIAPRYWLGFKSEMEYPPGIIAPWMETIDVD